MEKINFLSVWATFAVFIMKRIYSRSEQSFQIFLFRRSESNLSFYHISRAGQHRMCPLLSLSPTLRSPRIPRKSPQPKRSRTRRYTPPAEGLCSVRRRESGRKASLGRIRTEGRSFGGKLKWERSSFSLLKIFLILSNF
jgi:hypothetical protein